MSEMKGSLGCSELSHIHTQLICVPGNESFTARANEEKDFLSFSRVPTTDN